MKDKVLILYEKKGDFLTKIPSGGGDESKIEPLIKFLELIRDIEKGKESIIHS